MSEKGDQALNREADEQEALHAKVTEFLGKIEPDPEAIEGLQNLLLQMDEEGALPLDSKLSEFFQHALDLLENGETVVFTVQPPEELPEDQTADNSYTIGDGPFAGTVVHDD